MRFIVFLVCFSVVLVVSIAFNSDYSVLLVYSKLYFLLFSVFSSPVLEFSGSKPPKWPVRP